MFIIINKYVPKYLNRIEQKISFSFQSTIKIPWIKRMSTYMCLYYHSDILSFYQDENLYFYNIFYNILLKIHILYLI